MNEQRRWLSRVSARRPARDEVVAARRVFLESVSGYESALHAASSSDAGGLDEADRSDLWSRTVRHAAPDFVRGNAWLLTRWGAWCVAKEEPALCVLGGLGALVTASALAYPLVRAFAAALINLFAN